MKRPTETDAGALLAALVGGGVEFIVVGGAAAVLHGASTATQDLDVVFRRSLDNAERLLTVLEELDARIRDATGRELRPSAELLNKGRQILLSTRLGPLDCLGELHDGRDYEAIASQTVSMSDGKLRFDVIDLETLVEIKRSTGRARDRAVLPELLALLRSRD